MRVASSQLPCNVSTTTRTAGIVVHLGIRGWSRPPFARLRSRVRKRARAPRRPPGTGGLRASVARSGRSARGVRRRARRAGARDPPRPPDRRTHRRLRVRRGPSPVGPAGRGERTRARREHVADRGPGARVPAADPADPQRAARNHGRNPRRCRRRPDRHYSRRSTRAPRRHLRSVARAAAVHAAAVVDRTAHRRPPVGWPLPLRRCRRSRAGGHGRPRNHRRPAAQRTRLPGRPAGAPGRCGRDRAVARTATLCRSPAAFLRARPAVSRPPRLRDGRRSLRRG